MYDDEEMINNLNGTIKKCENTIYSNPISLFDINAYRHTLTEKPKKWSKRMTGMINEACSVSTLKSKAQKKVEAEKKRKHTQLANFVSDNKKNETKNDS